MKTSIDDSATTLDISQKDRQRIELIAYRADEIGLNPYGSIADLVDDIALAHKVAGPIRFMDLFTAEPFDFASEVRGIVENLNRSVPSLEYSLHYSDKDVERDKTQIQIPQVKDVAQNTKTEAQRSSSANDFER